MCDCGHSFVLKRKVSADTTRKSKRIAKRCQRALETTSETECRQKQNAASMANKRALETPSETQYRQKQNAASMANKRALETPSETQCRQKQNAASMANKRALETPSETVCRQKQNAASMANKRALETPSETVCRQKQNAASMAKKRKVDRIEQLEGIVTAVDPPAIEPECTTLMEPKIAAVFKLETFFKCLRCGSRTEPAKGISKETRCCNKECGILNDSTFCEKFIATEILVVDKERRIRLSAFGEVVNELLGKNVDIISPTEEELLRSPPISELRFKNNEIIKVLRK